MNSRFNDLQYWNKYYDDILKSSINSEPSPFARYLVEAGMFQNRTSVFELGCGNGRDSLYFTKQGMIVVAVDQCQNTTLYLNKFDNLTSFNQDFTNLDALDPKTEIIYSRFTFHSIDVSGEDRTLSWVYNNLKKDGLFCIEARTIKDPLCGKGIDKGNNIWFHNDHHRRFINADIFKMKLEKAGFSIIQFEENSGFAKHKDEDPTVLRAILKKV